MSQGLKVLYEDQYVTITECYILIKKYYMPLMTSKTVLFEDVKAFSIHDASKVNSRWGISTHHLNNWFQYDSNRKNKTKFISIDLKNSKINPAITPEDVDKAFNALREHFAAIDRKSVIFQSNRDKQTELNHKQAHEMMKQQLEHEQNERAQTSEQQLQIKKETKNIQVEELQ